MLLQRRVVVLVVFLATTVATTAAFNLKGERIFNKNSFCDAFGALFTTLSRVSRFLNDYHHDVDFSTISFKTL